MPQKVSIDHLCDFVIHYFNNEGIEITPLKLQKILYYIQAWHLVFFDKHPLFDEQPEAWVNGPVYRTIYNRFKNTWFRDKPIHLASSETDLIEKLKRSLKILNLDDEQEKLLNTVLKRYGRLSTGELVFLTHAENPWNDAREGLGPFEYSKNYISFESMYSYYKKRLEK